MSKVRFGACDPASDVFEVPLAPCILLLICSDPAFHPFLIAGPQFSDHFACVRQVEVPAEVVNAL